MKGNIGVMIVLSLIIVGSVVVATIISVLKVAEKEDESQEHMYQEFLKHKKMEK